MREIKFRAWEPELKIFYYFDLYTLYCINPMKIKMPKPGEDNAMVLFNINHRPQEQFVGQCDKNGKEIYEGDIVACPFQNSKHKTRWFSYPVVFTGGNELCTSHDPRFTMEYWLDNTRGDYRWIPLLSDCVVVGNIHEQPTPDTGRKGE